MCDFHFQAFSLVRTNVCVGVCLHSVLCMIQRNAHSVPFAVYPFFYSNEYKLFGIILPHAMFIGVIGECVCVCPIQQCKLQSNQLFSGSCTLSTTHTHQHTSRCTQSSCVLCISFVDYKCSICWFGLTFRCCCYCSVVFCCFQHEFKGHLLYTRPTTAQIVCC